ncbi:MAG: SUMF1/EgtB/PvdO family nonheme iron enzyme [Kiritimatiellae bacterium]|nr:SUMF1/EgtB/PvdO family nonheme iron enzyme [Kiritimatiellia bacterium]
MKNTIKHVSLLALLSLSLRGVADGQSVDPGIAAMNAEDISVYVESVDGNQRWPWNGLVDIDFTFRCPGYPGAYAFVEMSAFYESAPGVTNDLPLSTLTLNGENLTFPWATTAGTYRVTWDAGKDAPSVNVKNAKYRVRVNMARYMVLTADKENKKVLKSYLDAPDYKEGTQEWKDEYKTTKMALRLIQPHSNVVGAAPTEFGYNDPNDCTNGEWVVQRKVTVTKPYYIGIYECTRAQAYAFGMEGLSKPYSEDDTLPRKRSYNNLRGSFADGINWPKTGSRVSENSSIGYLRKRANDEGFDLPTDAEWELAARAGYDTPLNMGVQYTDSNDNRKNMLGPIAQCQIDVTEPKSGDTPYQLQRVGLKIPNRWGLYDCHGNVYEFVLDVAAYDSSSEPAIDPLGPISDVESRPFRKGGAYNSRYHLLMIGAHRDPNAVNPDEYKEWDGFRLCWRFPTPEMAD